MPIKDLIVLRNSEIQGVVPTIGELTKGEPALNLADKILYFSDGSEVFSVGVDNTRVIGSQTAHNMTVGTPVYFNPAQDKWYKAIASDKETVATHLVTRVKDADTLEVAQSGYVDGIAGGVPGTIYYTDPFAVGTLTQTEPTIPGQYSNPIYLSLTATSGFILPYRSKIVEGTELVQDRQTQQWTSVTGQTDFTLTHDGPVDLFLNGSFLIPGATEDYTRTGQTITLAKAISNDTDYLFAISWPTFEIADSLTEAVADTKYARITRPRKNRLLNGDFGIDQRAGSYVSAGYCLDRWVVEQNGPSSFTVTQEEFPLNDAGVVGSPRTNMKCAFTGDGTADSFLSISQRVANIREYLGKSLTLSFWAKADSSKNISVETSFNGGSGGGTEENALTVNKVAISNQWVKYTVNINIPSTANVTLSGSNNDFLDVRFWYYAGSDYAARTDSLGNQSGNIWFTRMQLEVGEEATDFEYRDETDEFNLCVEYYWNTGGGNIYTMTTTNSTTNLRRATMVYFPRIMRAPPVVSRTYDGASPSEEVTNSYYRMLLTASGAAAAAPLSDVIMDAEL